MTEHPAGMAKPLQGIRTFFKEVIEEMKQVSWSTREEMVGSLLVVFVGVVLMAIFIGICDFVLSKMAQVLLTK